MVSALVTIQDETAKQSTALFCLLSCGIFSFDIFLTLICAPLWRFFLAKWLSSLTPHPISPGQSDLRGGVREQEAGRHK